MAARLQTPNAAHSRWVAHIPLPAPKLEVLGGDLASIEAGVTDLPPFGGLNRPFGRIGAWGIFPARIKMHQCSLNVATDHAAPVHQTVFSMLLTTARTASRPRCAASSFSRNSGTPPRK